MRLIFYILSVLLPVLPLMADRHTTFYMQRLSDPELDVVTKLEYVDSLLAGDRNANADSLLRLKVRWAFEIGNYDASIDAYNRLGDKIAEKGISTECALRLDYIKSLRSKKQYVKSMSLCSELLRLEKPDSLIYYDALAYATIHDFIRQSNLPFNEDYMKKVVDILSEASAKQLPQYSIDRIRHALHTMRMKKALSENNYDMSLAQADSLLRIPMIENERESLEANIAFIYMLIGQYEAAENYFKKLLDTDKASYNIGISLMNYTHMLNLQGRYQESIDLINKYEHVAKGLNKDIYYSHLLGNKAIAESHTVGFEQAYNTLLYNKELEDSLFFNSNIQDGILLFDYTGKSERMAEMEKDMTDDKIRIRVLFVFLVLALALAIVAIVSLVSKWNECKSLRQTIAQYESVLAEKERMLSGHMQSESGKAAAQLLQFAKMEEVIASISEIVAAKAKSADEKIKSINDLLSSSKVDNDTREVFEQQFEQAHSQFFKRLYATHPDLTPGESRMCAYLIMNLSSKEIASITNKTIRSVEATRYRIGKKLNLPEGKTLTVYLRLFL